MKKLFLILFLCPFFSHSQITQYLGAPNTRVENRGQFQVDSIFFLGQFPDTNRLPGRAGAFLFNTTDKQVYFYSGTQWILLVGNGFNIAGTGLSSTGTTVKIAPSGVIAGPYNLPTFSVNLQGQITGAGN